MKLKTRLPTELQTKKIMLLHSTNHQQQTSRVDCSSGITEEIRFKEILEEKSYSDYWNFGMGNHKRTGWGFKGQQDHQENREKGEVTRYKLVIEGSLYAVSLFYAP